MICHPWNGPRIQPVSELALGAPSERWLIGLYYERASINPVKFILVIQIIRKTIIGYLYIRLHQLKEAGLLERLHEQSFSPKSNIVLESCADTIVK